MNRVPTDAEIVDAARRLGVVDSDGNVPRSQRARLAKAVQLAWDDDKETEREADREHDRLARLNEITNTYVHLRDRIGATAAEAITAALAPLIYRQVTAKGSL